MCMDLEAQSSLYLYLSILLLLGFVLSIPLRRKGLPASLGYLLSGLLSAMIVEIPVEAVSFLKGVEEIAIMLLFFEIGYELNVEKIKELAGFPLYLSLLEVFFATLMSLGLGLLMGLDMASSLIIGVSASFSSTVFTYKLLEDIPPSRREVRELIYRVVIVEDIILIIALGLIEFFSMGLVEPIRLLVPITTPLILFTASYEFTHKYLKKYIGDDENSIILVIGYGLLLSYVSVLLESSPAIGAFVAGLSFSGIHRELIARLRPIRSFALFLFFVSMGIGLTSYGVSTEIIGSSIIVALLLVLIHTVATMTASLFMSGLSMLYGLESGIYLSTLSELGLLVAYRGLQLGLIGPQYALGIPFAVLIASLTSALMASRKTCIVIRIYNRIPDTLRRIVNIITLTLHGKITSRRYGLALKLLHTLLHIIGEVIILSVVFTLIINYALAYTNILFIAPLIATVYLLIYYKMVKRAMKIVDHIIELSGLPVTREVVSETHRFIITLNIVLTIIAVTFILLLLNYRYLAQAIGPLTTLLLGALVVSMPIILLLIIYLVER